MALQSMKLGKKDMPKPEAVGSDEYGYGLSIHLESSQVERLGLESCEPGEKIRLEAIGEVRSVTLNKNKDGNGYSMSIQITDMDATKQSGGPAAKAIYGS